MAVPFRLICRGAGNLVGLVLSPLILSAFGWRTLFLAFGVFGGPLLLLWQLVVPDQHQQQQQQQQQKDDRGQQSGLADAAPTAAALLRTQPSAAEVQAVADTQPSGGAATASTAPTADAVEQPSTPQQSATRAAVPAVGVLKLLSKTAVWAIVVANIVNHWCGAQFARCPHHLASSLHKLTCSSCGTFSHPSVNEGHLPTLQLSLLTARVGCNSQGILHFPVPHAFVLFQGGPSHSLLPSSLQP